MRRRVKSTVKVIDSIGPIGADDEREAWKAALELMNIKLEKLNLHID